MSRLGLKGHATRGKEVIKLLEMFGGWNYNHWDGKTSRILYFINGDMIEVKTIRHNTNIDEFNVFTLEEFLEKYPYKVGDEVEYKSIGDANLKSKIIYMEWCNSLNKVLYTTEDAQVISTEDIIETKSIPPYMDYDIKENKEKKINQMSLANCDLDEVEIVLGDKFELKIREGKYYAIRKKILYPKTYEECCDILRIETNRTIEHDNCLGYRNITLYDINLLTQLRYFRKLLICRDVYWKIAGEQMGLNKPWEPDFTNNDEERYGIYTLANKIERDFCGVGDVNMILSFPTEEIRDEFYNNFKELIEECKELL